MLNQNPKPSFYLYSLPAIIISAFLALSLVSAWTEPSTVPPGGNVSTPLNVGSTGQSKIGGLILNTGGAATGLIVDKGNVGIGTMSPRGKLDINGNVDITGKVGITGNVEIDQIGVLKFGPTFEVGGGSAPPSASMGLSGAESLQIGIANGYGWLQGSPVGVPISINPNGGNVGIGATSPGAKLEVAGQIKITGGSPGANKVLTSDAAGLASWQTSTGGANYWTLSGSSLYPNQTSYNLGVGTTSLDSNYKITTSGGGIKAESSSQPAGYFSSASGYGLIVQMGNVGIGTTAPTQKLDVHGNIIATGNINTSGDFQKNNIPVIQCNWDGLRAYFDEGGSNDFGVICRNGVIERWCHISGGWRGYYQGRYTCP